MAFTVTALEQFRKYRVGGQNAAQLYSMGRNPVYEELNASKAANSDVRNNETFCTGDPAYFEGGDSLQNDIFKRAVPSALRGCFCFNTKKLITTFGDAESTVFELWSGSTSVFGIGAGGDEAANPQDPTYLYKNGQLVYERGALDGGIPAAYPVRVEIYWYINDTVGELKLFIDGNLQYSFTGNTDFAAGGGIDSIIITSDPDAFIVYDYYFGSVDAEADMPKRPFSINQLPVNSDQLTTNWTAGGGGAHYADIDDETICDGDTTKITATSNVAKCLFGIEDQCVPAGYKPFAVQLITLGKRYLDAPDVCDIRPIALSNATEVQGEYSQLLTGSYEFSPPLLLTVDPNGDIPWTAAGLAALQVGAELRIQP